MYNFKSVLSSGFLLLVVLFLISTTGNEAQAAVSCSSQTNYGGTQTGTPRPAHNPAVCTLNGFVGEGGFQLTNYLSSTSQQVNIRHYVNGAFAANTATCSGTGCNTGSNNGAGGYVQYCLAPISGGSCTIGYSYQDSTGATTSFSFTIPNSGTGVPSFAVSGGGFDPDVVAPTVAITTDSGGRFNESAPGTFTATVTFSEPVTGFVSGELTATNASIGALSPSGGSGTVFTAVITPAGTGTVSLNVAGNVAQDGASNNNTAASQRNVYKNYDVVPTATITTNSIGFFNQSAPGTFTATVTFSESVSFFTDGDLTATNASVGALSPSGGAGGTVFTAVITPAGTGDIALNVAGNVAEDIHRNDNTAAPQVTVGQFDDVAPTAVISISGGSSFNQSAPSTFTVTVTFSEPVTGFVSGELTATNASLAALSPSGGAGTVFTAVMTPAGTGNVSLNVAGSVAQDSASNNNTAASEVTITQTDDVAPTVVITTGGVLGFGESALTPFTTTVTFSETVTGFVNGDLTASNASVGALSPSGGAGTVFTAVITPAGTGNVALNVAGSVAQDGASNNNTAAPQVTVGQNDDVAPTVVITTNSIGFFNQSTPGSFTATVTFSEPVIGFISGDLTATNASLFAVSPSGGAGTVFTVVVSPAGTGDVALNIAGSVAQDSASNNNTAASQVTVGQNDDVAPTVVITTSSIGFFNQSTPGSFTATVTFSEPVMVFADGELTATNAAIGSISGSGSTYTATITPAGTGNVALNIAGGVVQDSGSNNNTAAPQVIITQSDDVAPRIASIQRQAPTTATTDSDTLMWRVTFSENVTGVDASDFAVGGGTTATVTGVATVTPSSVFDVTVSGGDLAALEGIVTLTAIVATGNIQDTIGNNFSNPAPTGTNNNSYTVSNDSISPTVSILNAPTMHDRINAFNVTFQFSEDVYNFVAGDVTLGNATISNFVAVDANTYTADITPNGALNIDIQVNANVANDLAGNQNLAAIQVTVNSSIVAETQTTIANFMSNRANHIIGNQPSFIGFLTGRNSQGGGPAGNLQLEANKDSQIVSFFTSRSKILNAQNGSQSAYAPELKKTGINHSRFGLNSDSETANSGVLAVAPTNSDGSDQPNSVAPKNRAGTWDLWTQVNGVQSSQTTTSSRLWTANIGSHYFVTNDTLIGVVGQIDWAGETNSTTNSKVNGTGYMIGPYIAGKIKDQNLFYEARATWGQSSNTISPIGTYTDKFSTSRLLVKGKVQGSYKMGDISFNPSLSVSYFEETQNSYTDSLANLIPAQTISLGEFKFGPELSHTVELDNDFKIVTTLGASGIANFGIRNANTSSGYALGNKKIRARVDAGVKISNASGLNLAVMGFYDGLGVSGYQSYGGSFKFIIIPQS